VDSGNIKPLRYKLFERLDAEKVNAAFDVMEALNGVQYYARFMAVSRKKNEDHRFWANFVSIEKSVHSIGEMNSQL
jgi:hypothetical protein